MRYNFTDGIRFVLARAREEAIRHGAGAVDTEHILLPLLDPRPEETGVWLSRFEARGLRLADVRRALEEVAPVSSGGSGVRLGSLPYTSGSKKVLELMMREARQTGSSSVTAEHALVALADEPYGLAGRLLRHLGLDGATLRSDADLSELQPLPANGIDLGEATRPPGSAGPDALVRIDDASGSSIAEQIITQIQEAIATGRVAPGEQLPPVRTLADQLDIAPGTVARAYRELEGRGLVVTQGARGTRVAPPTARTTPDHERPDLLAGLLRPVAVAAYHMGATARELRDALEDAMGDIFGGARPEEH